MTKILIILPNTLFEKSIEDIKKHEIDNILIVYDKYYFNSNQHKQKLVLWFSAIEEYKKFIKEKLDIKIEECLEFKDKAYEIKKNTIYYIYSPLDKYMIKKYKKISNQLGKDKYITLKNRSVILSEDELKETYNELIKSDIKGFKKINIRHTDFYKYMRVKYNILLENDQKPEGGYWSYDVQNRQRFDKNYTEKKLYVNNCNEVEYAKKQVNKYFKNALNISMKWYGKLHLNTSRVYHYFGCFYSLKDMQL
jgi:deoxyribodipyrimidine photolyase-related protein